MLIKYPIVHKTNCIRICKSYLDKLGCHIYLYFIKSDIQSQGCNFQGTKKWSQNNKRGQAIMDTCSNLVCERASDVMYNKGLIAEKSNNITQVIFT